MKIFPKLSTLFKNLVAQIISRADEIAIQSYVPQDVIHYENFIRNLPETQFVTGEGRAMEAVVPADFLPYYRASLVVTEDLSMQRASSYSLYIRLERKVERTGNQTVPLIGYFPLMCTQSERVKNNMLQEWNKNDSFARSWLSRDIGVIPQNKWLRAQNEISRQKFTPLP